MNWCGRQRRVRVKVCCMLVCLCVCRVSLCLCVWVCIACQALWSDLCLLKRVFHYLWPHFTLCQVLCRAFPYEESSSNERVHVLYVCVGVCVCVCDLTCPYLIATSASRYKSTPQPLLKVRCVGGVNVSRLQRSAHKLQLSLQWTCKLGVGKSLVLYLCVCFVYLRDCIAACNFSFAI